MSEEEGGFGVSLIEKLFGFAIFIVGIFTLYYLYISVQVLGNYGGLFAFLNIIIIVIGLLLMTAKTE